MLVRFVTVCLALLASTSAWAADSATAPAAPPPAGTAMPPSGTAASPAPAHQGGPKAAEFAKVNSQWKDMVAKLMGMKIEYANSADAAKKSAIAKEFNSLRPSADALLDKLIDAAKAAYAESPNTNKELTDLLVSTLSDCTYRESQNHQKIGSDDYERAFPIGKLLMDNKCTNESVPDLAGIAAFCVNEFDLAESYLKQAQEKGHIDAVAAQDLSLIGFYKEAWAKEKKIRAAEATADDLPRVLMKTTAGDIEIELFENEAPNTVLNFITLVDKGFYNGLSFHRVLPGFMAQGGDPKGDGSGGPGYMIPCECYRPDYRVHFRGSLSMAHTAQPNTGGSQFFLTFVPTHHLDGLHTVFGRVLASSESNGKNGAEKIPDGYSVLSKIKRRNPEEDTVGDFDKIIEAKVIRRRKHSYDAKDLKKS